MTASPAVPAVPAVPLARVRAQDLAPYPIDIEFPDLERFRRGSTPVGHVHVFDSAQPGPTVMLNALTHGNEVCGAVALATLLDARIRPRRGRLIVSFANVQAYARFDANDPDRARFVDEDFNRVWSPAQLDGPRRSADLDRAREIRPFVDDADFLLDLHSMHEACAPVMVCGPLDKGAALARRLATPAWASAFCSRRPSLLGSLIVRLRLRNDRQGSQLGGQVGRLRQVRSDRW